MKPAVSGRVARSEKIKKNQRSFFERLRRHSYDKHGRFRPAARPLSGGPNAFVPRETPTTDRLSIVRDRIRRRGTVGPLKNVSDQRLVDGQQHVVIPMRARPLLQMAPSGLSVFVSKRVVTFGAGGWWWWGGN